MDIDCENRCGDRKKKGVDLMTGAELIKWIQDNHAEDMTVMASDDYYNSYFVSEVSIKEREFFHESKVKKVIFLE